MALTSNSDAAGRFHESAFNKIIKQFMLQRPDIFNYGTERVISNNLFCNPIEAHPDYIAEELPKQTQVDLLPIPTVAGTGMEYCLQFKELKVDFIPESEITLPPELGGIALQQFALTGTVCGGIGCEHAAGRPFDIDIKPLPDSIDSASKAAKAKAASKAKAKSKATAKSASAKAKAAAKASAKTKAAKSSKSITKVTVNKSKGMIFIPFDTLRMNCFCLSLFVKLIVVRDDTHLKLKLVGLELQDIAPLGLENSIECYLKEVLELVVFPKIEIALEDLIFGVKDYFTISPAPISTRIPHNPDVSGNNLSIFLNVN